MSEQMHTNALAGESSPYLLQHAHNPVNWYPWSPEAQQRARDEDKPILLSIGYSACHWCHVMERESFENQEIAALMNRDFVSIKVDREERPDLDSIYMTAVQMLTGGGGWPMTVFLTPDLVPFYAGTYFPPEDRHGMPGFPRVLTSVARAFREKRDAIRHDAVQVLEALRNSTRLSLPPADISAEVLDSALAQLASSYDDRYGGFGQAPKFPPSMALLFLLRSYERTRKTRYREMADHTLEQMARGGIYDQLGGGFHRYSVDQVWLVPHFEKMLYDNALLSKAYLEAYLLSHKLLYRRITEETLDYILREMTSPEGGFYSAQDADSEGEEGKYFVWTPAEVRDVLPGGEAELFCRYFDIAEQGNFEGKSILHVPKPIPAFASNNSVDVDTLSEIIARGRTLLLRRRETRVKPGRDQKILTSWNALMLRSLAEAANGLERDDYRHAAERNAGFLLDRLQAGGRLLHSYTDGKARHNGYLEDYSFLLDALLSVYECTFDARWVRESTRLAHILVDQFWDDDAGAFYFTSSDHEQLIYRPKDLYDNAVPSGNSAAAWALLRLAELTGEASWKDYAVRVLKGMTGMLSKHPGGFANFLCGLDFCLSSPKEIAIWGDPAAPGTRQMLREIFSRYVPNKVVACGVDSAVPLLVGRHPIDGRPTAYVCRNFSCRAPITSPAELGALLEER